MNDVNHTIKLADKMIAATHMNQQYDLVQQSLHHPFV